MTRGTYVASQVPVLSCTCFATRVPDSVGITCKHEYRTRRDAPNPRKYVFRHPTVIRAGDVEHIRTCEQ